MAFELSQIVTELVESVCFGRKLEGGNDCLVNLFGGPAPDGTAVMQEYLQQPDDPLVMDFDAWITDRADGDGQSDSLKQRKVHMNVEGLGLETGEAVGDDVEPFTDSVEMFEPLVQAEVAQVVGDELIAQEAGELLILF